MVNLCGLVLPGRIRSQTPQRHVPFSVHLWCIKTLAPAVYKQGERIVVDLCGLDADRLANECSPRNKASFSEHGNMILPIFQIVFQVEFQKNEANYSPSEKYLSHEPVFNPVWNLLCTNLKLFLHVLFCVYQIIWVCKSLILNIVAFEVPLGLSV